MSDEKIFRDLLQRDGIGTINQITCGYFDCSRDGYAGLSVSSPRKVTRFEIEFYLSNGLSTTVDGTEYPIKENWILIAKPGQIRFSYLPFQTMYLKFFAVGALADRISALPTYFPSVNTQRILELFSEINVLYDNISKELLFQSKMLQLLYVIIGDSLLSGHSANINLAVASAAKKFITENYARPISLNDIANAVSLSPNHFHTVFKATCQMTPHEYLMSKRLSAAKEMLWRTDMSIPEIAEKCGFGCQQYFTQIFKKLTGDTPGKYRKQLQDNYFS